MGHVITFGDVLIASGVVVGVIIVFACIIWFLAALAKGMSR